ncbi:hypothetical protein NMY22_g10408 [Coprinellus aureogranulatus]|nr:hypothetical protein NMY22_g10408 [Coprinellus aureogranulatus]
MNVPIQNGTLCLHAGHGSTFFPDAHNWQVGQIHIVNHDGAGTAEFFSQLNPILDASHTRNRKVSPLNSDCFPGTRTEVIRDIKLWTTSNLSDEPQHILGVYGYAGCGKSAIAQTLAVQLADERRLGASFFFFRGTGPRSRVGRFAATLARQVAVMVPGTAQHMEKAVIADPGLLDSSASLVFQLRKLVYDPVQAVAAALQPYPPFIIIIDGLDECEDKEEASVFVKDLINFFEQNPRVPLRFLITSRVEDHLHRILHSAKHVRLFNLVDRTSDEDIATALDVAIEDANGSRVLASSSDWLSPADKQDLIEHIGGSFIFMTTITKFLFGPFNDDGLTPVERLPLALNMNPGFDALYAGILERSQHFPHFSEITGTIVLAQEPLSIAQIAAVLSIKVFSVVNLLVNMHSIFQVPGDDHTPITLWHTSLRDFLTSERRSRHLFASPKHHRQLAYWYITSSRPRALDSLSYPPAEWRFALKHLTKFVRSIQDNVEALRSELDGIIAHLRKTFPVDFDSVLPIYFRFDHRFLNPLRGQDRPSTIASLIGSECPLIVRDNKYPWPIISGALETGMDNLGELELLGHLQQSHSHVLDPHHHLAMVARGIRHIITHDGHVKLWAAGFDGGSDYTTEYMFCCWPRHLALAMHADPQNPTFAPLQPSPTRVERTEAVPSGHRRLDVSLAALNVEFAERVIQKVRGNVKPGVKTSDKWCWNAWTDFVFGEPVSTSSDQSITVYDFLQVAFDPLYPATNPLARTSICQERDVRLQHPTKRSGEGALSVLRTPGSADSSTANTRAKRTIMTPVHNDVHCVLKVLLQLEGTAPPMSYIGWTTYHATTPFLHSPVSRA